MKVHELKCVPPFFQALIAPESSRKTFELRRNDRKFGIGDILHEREWDPINQTYTGRECWLLITFILEDEVWLQKGFVALATLLLRDKWCRLADVPPGRLFTTVTDNFLVTTIYRENGVVECVCLGTGVFVWLGSNTPVYQVNTPTEAIDLYIRRRGEEAPC